MDEVLRASQLALLVVFILAPLTAPLIVMCRLGFRHGSNPHASLIGIVLRAVAWSVPLSWTLLVLVGHGVAVIPAPTWLAFFITRKHGPSNAIPFWLTPTVPILAYVFASFLGWRRRERQYE